MSRRTSFISVVVGIITVADRVAKARFDASVMSFPTSHNITAPEPFRRVVINCHNGVAGARFDARMVLLAPFCKITDRGAR